jgi:hypothetical protein
MCSTRLPDVAFIKPVKQLQEPAPIDSNEYCCKLGFTIELTPAGAGDNRQNFRDFEKYAGRASASKNATKGKISD